MSTDAQQMQPPTTGSSYKGKPTNENTYENRKNTGTAIIFGTQSGTQNLQEILQKFGFKVRERKTEEINTELIKVSKEDHKENDCLMIVVKANGNNKINDLEDLWKNFLGDACKSLIDKPKIFIIQVGYTATTQQLERDSNNYSSKEISHFIPTTADLLVYYSYSEKCSDKCNEQDSWFIQSLCSELSKAAITEAARTDGVDLLQLLTNVNREVIYKCECKGKQLAFMSTLTKKFLLRVKN